jgi:uncharacterized protein
VSYRARAVDQAVADLLDVMGATLIEGARGCGQASTGLHHARSSIRLDGSPRLVELADLNPHELLRGETPRLIDEWQLAPSLWNAIRHEIDDRQGRGQFILSGSAAPRDDVTRHSGAGRFGRLHMRPMALAESHPPSDQVSLGALGDSARVTGRSPLTYEQLAFLAVRGGWPALLDASDRQAIVFNRSYVDDLCSTEIPAATGIRHDAVKLRRLLESLARNLSSEATLQSLASDVSGTGSAVDPKTIAAYLDSLRRVFAVEDLPAWSVALRSRSRLRTSAKLHLVDPALACAALGIGPERLARDPEFFGHVFESMVIRDLRALASANFGRVYHYRDNTNLEIDAIVEYPTGTWGAIEVKLGSSKIGDAERNLLTLRESRVDLGRVGAPAFLAVVTGTEFAYTLPSGVHVLPLGVLTA